MKRETLLTAVQSAIEKAREKYTYETLAKEINVSRRALYHMAHEPANVSNEALCKVYGALVKKIEYIKTFEGIKCEERMIPFNLAKKKK